MEYIRQRWVNLGLRKRRAAGSSPARRGQEQGQSTAPGTRTSEPRARGSETCPPEQVRRSREEGNVPKRHFTLQLRCGSENQNHMWAQPRKAAKVCCPDSSLSYPLSSPSHRGLEGSFFRKLLTESFVSGTTKTFYSTQKTPLVLGVQNYFQSSLYVLSFFVLPLAKGSTVHTDTILFGSGRGVSRVGPDLHTLFWISGKNHESTTVKVSGSL